MSDEKEPISQEQYDTLIEKLTKVEEMLGDGLKELVEKLTEKVDGFEESTATLQKDVTTLQEIEPVEIPEILSTDSIQKMIDETIEPVSKSQKERLDKIEKGPLFKGPVEDTTPPEEKEKDILKGVLRHAFPEVNINE